MTVLCKWEDLPDNMRTEEVRPYYDILAKKQKSLIAKRIFDIVVASIMLIFLSPVFLVLAILIKKDSEGPVFYRQERVTQYGKTFKIHKFRTMVNNADKIGSQISVSNDSRVTRVGHFIRKYRIDEFAQLIDIIEGNMTFVSTRPEVPKYVEYYSKEMMATLLLPAGVTSEASIQYKDEADLLDAAEDVDKVYIEQILQEKMKYNLSGLKNFSFINDIVLMIKTVIAVLK